jgi:hypothetical protein
MFRRNDRERVVDAAEKEGQRHFKRGDLTGAIGQYEEGCRLGRQMVADDPANTRIASRLAAMLCMLGQWQLAAGRPAEALGSLNEAETRGKRLGEQATQLIADVVIQRATARAELGAPLSAIEDVQRAVMASMRWALRDRDSRALDAARVAGIAATVLLHIGADPDLAHGAADMAIATYQERLPRVRGQWSIPPEHTAAVGSAARVAAVTHAAAGRGDLAEPVRVIATQLTDGGWPEFDAEVVKVRARPTLAQALLMTDRDDLATLMTVPIPTVGVLPYVPEMRGAPGLRATFAPELAEFLPTFGSELSKVQAGDLPRPARMLLGLEAHAMFAAASRAEVMGLRYRFGDLGPHWARAVLACAGLMNVSGERADVRDAIGWLTGICGQLGPFAIIDSAARDLVVECLSWSRDIHAEDGDADAVASLDSVLAMLDSLPPVGGETTGGWEGHPIGSSD